MTDYATFYPPRTADPRMKTRRFQMLIDGRSVDAESRQTISRESPAYDGLVTSEIPRGSFADAEKAVLAARRAFDEGPWPKMSGQERSRIMHRVADAFSEHAEELATIDALDGGKAIAASRNEAGAAASFWHFAAGHAEGLTGETHNAFGADSLGLMLREPIGVVGVITPWNYPMVIASERVPWLWGRVHRSPQAVGVYLGFIHPSGRAGA